MAVSVQHRRGSASEWGMKDTILRAGEIGVEIESGWFKVGDGATHWNNLPYHIDADGVVALILDVITDNPSGAHAEELIGDMDDLTTVNKNTVVEALNEVNTTQIPLDLLYENAKAG